MVKARYSPASDAVQSIESGARVFVHGGAATPHALVSALLARAGEVHNIELVCISLHGAIDWNHSVVQESFFLNSLFVSDNVRDWVARDAGEYVPVFLSEIPNLFQQGILQLDVALVQVSPPDVHGYCTLGTSVDAALSATHCAKKVIAQVNPLMPRVHGDRAIHISRFDALVWEEAVLPEVSDQEKTNDISNAIGSLIAGLIE